MLSRLRLILFILVFLIAVGLGIGISKYLSNHADREPQLTKEQACKLVDQEKYLPGEEISINEAICNGTLQP